MGKKVELTKEQTARLMASYDKIGTYSGAAKENDISISVATRIIKEQLSINESAVIPVVTSAKYNGATPIDIPNYDAIVYFYDMPGEWIREYYD